MNPCDRFTVPELEQKVSCFKQINRMGYPGHGARPSAKKNLDAQNKWLQDKFTNQHFLKQKNLSSCHMNSVFLYTVLQKVFNSILVCHLGHGTCPSVPRLGNGSQNGSNCLDPASDHV